MLMQFKLFALTFCKPAFALERVFASYPYRVVKYVVPVAIVQKMDSCRPSREKNKTIKVYSSFFFVSYYGDQRLRKRIFKFSLSI